MRLGVALGLNLLQGSGQGTPLLLAEEPQALRQHRLMRMK